MAMSSAAVAGGTYTKRWDVSATADADTGDVTIAHGLGAAPADVTLTPLLAAGYLAQWVLKSVDATNIVITKASTQASSGNAAASVRVTARLPHSAAA